MKIPSSKQEQKPLAVYELVREGTARSLGQSRGQMPQEFRETWSESLPGTKWFNSFRVQGRSQKQQRKGLSAKAAAVYSKSAPATKSIPRIESRWSQAIALLDNLSRITPRIAELKYLHSRDQLDLSSVLAFIKTRPALDSLPEQLRTPFELDELREQVWRDLQFDALAPAPALPDSDAASHVSCRTASLVLMKQREPTSLRALEGEGALEKTSAEIMRRAKQVLVYFVSEIDLAEQEEVPDSNPLKSRSYIAMLGENDDQWESSPELVFSLITDLNLRTPGADDAISGVLGDLHTAVGLVPLSGAYGRIEADQKGIYCTALEGTLHADDSPSI